MTRKLGPIAAVVVFAVSVVLFPLGAVGRTDPTAQRSCTVNIRLEDAEGHPIEGVAVRVTRPGDSVRDAMLHPNGGVTNVDGKAAVVLSLPSGEVEVAVQLVGGLGKSVSRERNKELFERWAGVVNQFAVAKVYRQRIGVGQTAVDVAIVLRRGLELTGRVVSDGRPVANASVYLVEQAGAAHATAGYSGLDGFFTLTQAPPDQRFWLLVMKPPYRTVVRVEAHAGPDAIELGDIELGPIGEPCELVGVQVTNWSGVKESELDRAVLESYGRGLTFVRDRGDVVLAFESHENREGFLGFGGDRNTRSICVPAGKYFVLPGWANNEREIWRAVSLIKSQPSNASLPMVAMEVKAGAVAPDVVVMDAGEVQTKMDQAIGDVP